MDDPVVRVVVAAAGGVILLAIAARIWQRRRERAYAAQRRKELRATYGAVHLKQQEIDRLATKILATSSTRAIAGFAIVRQVEAVFTDGHRSTSAAVQTLKALAIERGANALINLSSERLPSGKCVAHGDAVIVKPLRLRSGGPRPNPPTAERPSSIDDSEPT